MAIRRFNHWRVGDIVCARGERWTIRTLRTWPDCTSLHLSGSRAASRTLLVPFDRPTRVERAGALRKVTVRRWLHEVRRAACELHPFGSLKAASASIRLVAYQLEPVLAMLRRGATRVLVADGVGLGKTVQAGLVMAELSAIDGDFRCLVVTPAGLRDQWERELDAHFTLKATQANAEWLRVAAASYPEDVNPWSVPGIHIASLDFIKRPEVLRPLEDVTWDLLVIDEAHQATLGTDRRTAAHAAGIRSRRIILLTATPHLDNHEEFDALCRIGRIDASDDPVVFFRRLRGEVGSGPSRRSTFLRVQLTPAEKQMHQLLERYTHAVWTEAQLRGDARAKLASIILRKRALSSPASLAASVRRRLELLSKPQPQPAVQLLLPLADEDSLEDAEPLDAMAAPGLDDPRRERRWLASIAEAAQHASRVESKTRRLLRLLARIREPLIVFTEYRDTLVRLERIVLAAGRPVVVLHGGLDPRERSRIQRRFNAGDVSLLATDAAAEGLNLHQRCRLVIHYELPWSAARIEQRAGRVDRLGQSRRVHEIALVASDTAERLVLAPLAARAARVRASEGGAAGLLDYLTESKVAELVMEPATLPRAEPTNALYSPIEGTRHDVHRSSNVASMDVRVEAQEEVARLEMIRSWRQRSSAIVRRRTSGGPVAAVIRRTAADLAPGLSFLFAVRLRDEDGRSVHAEPVLLHVFPRRDLVQRRTQDMTRIVRALTSGPDAPLSRFVAVRVRRMVSTMEAMVRRQQEAVLRREEALARTLPSAARQLVQAGLFDRRDLAAAARRERADNTRLEDAQARVSAVENFRVTSTATLTAVLFVANRRRGR
jgi:superfamily II DNA or RNA helicase